MGDVVLGLTMRLATFAIKGLLQYLWVCALSSPLYASPIQKTIANRAYLGTAEAVASFVCCPMVARAVAGVGRALQLPPLHQVLPLRLSLRLQA
jgi:hypothetical protein